MASPQESFHSLSSSSSPPKLYPSWRETNDEADYFEIPPDHFLAQQRGPSSKLWQSQASLSSADLDDSITSEHPVAATSSSAQTFGQPLSELASAIQQGIPAFPLPTAQVATIPRSNSDGQFAEPNEQMPDTSTLAAADFDVDVRSGFLPPEAPVVRLTGKFEECWESAFDQAKSLPLLQGGGGIKTGAEHRRQARRWRRAIREMPVLPLSDQVATDIRYARRGHLVLSFLAHFYLYSQPPLAPQQLPPKSWLSFFSKKTQDELQDEQDHADELSGKYSRTIPASIAVPWVQLSDKLDLPPILTYATTVLWNWAYIDPSKGLALDNLRMVETFSGTNSEMHFYLSSLLIEARGVEALQLMRVSLDEAFVGDRLARRRIASYLDRLSVVLRELTQLLHDVRTECDPKVFYWGIRPWFRGSDSVEGDQQPGWYFEGVDPPGVRRILSGPSAGQSSLIHVIDVFLDVDHTRRKARVSRPASERDARGADATFMERMQLYMPGHHRNFLTHLRNISFDDDAPEQGSQEEEPQEEREETEQVDQPSVQLDDEDGAVDQNQENASHDEDQKAPREPSHPIRSLALAAQEDGVDEGLPRAYDNVLAELKSLRDEHMRIAYLYIVSQARSTPPEEHAPLPKGFTGEPDLDAKTVTSKSQIDQADSASAKGVKGTGGTDLVSFLKDCRVNTIDAYINTASVLPPSKSDSSPSDQANPSDGSSASGCLGNGQSSSSLAGSVQAIQTNLSQLSLEQKQDDKTDSAPESLPCHSGLQIWAVNISNWEPSSQRFGALVETFLHASQSEPDRAKVQRYYRQIDRTRSLAARLLPRLMYKREYGVAWEETKFDTTKEGRPFLASPQLEKPTDFNISHDSDWVVMAFYSTKTKDGTSKVKSDPNDPLCAVASTSVDLRVGVDVMKLSLPGFEKNVASFCDTMDMALAPSEKEWVLAPIKQSQSESESLHRLFDFWTYKEAWTKNIGKGLGFDFNMVEFAFNEIAHPDPIAWRRLRTSYNSKQNKDTPILRIRGTSEPNYRFIEVILDPLPSSSSSSSSDASQLVVSLGPFQPGLSRTFSQITPPIPQTDALKSGLLTIWTMEDFVSAVFQESKIAAF